MDKSSNRTVLNNEEFIKVLRDIFSIDLNTDLSKDTDLSQYITDSIDLGELLAVIKQKYNIEPQRPELFSKYSKLDDVVKVINNQIAS